ncbi:site-specific integrase [Sphingobium sp. AS12]|uniref:site-specific integrase n=1 Tax=Sphingobium sp. AS12 TaxID=2849495 RepID=UPI001C319684|nr:site-specific integrase [Sphingobium sp. AS12]MBV2150712.1 site-specific integrase [Sphingobium sp. AS12]
MLERIFVMPKTVDRIMGCWLGPQIDDYVTALCEQGYAARSIYRRVPILTSFADFAAARNVDQIDQAEALVDAFVASWLSARCADRSADARRRSRNFVGVTVRHFFSLVVSKSEYRCNRTARADPFAVQVPGFFDHLREERGLRPRSICAYRHYLRRFERYLEDVGCELAVLSLPVVTGYITTVAQLFEAPRVSRRLQLVRRSIRYEQDNQQIFT